MVHVGNDFGISMIGVYNRHFTRMLRHIADHGDGAIARDAEGIATVGHMVGELFELSGYGIEAKFGVALIVIDEIDATVVCGPLHVTNVAVELGGYVMRSAAVAVHQVE